jgi:hypothetical protein
MTNDAQLIENGPMTKEIRKTNDELERGQSVQNCSGFGLRPSFVIGYLDIRYSTTAGSF